MAMTSDQARAEAMKQNAGRTPEERSRRSAKAYLHGAAGTVAKRWDELPEDLREAIRSVAR